jgi:membrane protein implicated in regulation of membrane protease activity
MWLVLGLLLLVAELLTPGGFYVIFFGVGALVVGALGLFGVHLSPASQWILFPVLSLLALGLFRRPLLSLFRIPTSADADRVDSLIGQAVVSLADMSPGAFGQVELRGAPWNARNVGPADIPRGARCVVERVQGLELGVRVASS